MLTLGYTLYAPLVERSIPDQGPENSVPAMTQFRGGAGRICYLCSGTFSIPLFYVSARSAQPTVTRLPAYVGTKRSHLNAAVLSCFGPVRLLETTPRAENALT